jgi:hypothetical protein
MKYRFRQIDFWEELKVAIGDRPVNIEDSGEEIIFDFGDYALTSQEEANLKTMMGSKPLLRRKLAKFVGKE